MNLTPKSEELFKQFCDSTWDWSGTPLLEITSNQRGNLTDLKRKGLVNTDTDEGCEWVHFTKKGYDYANSQGYDYEKY